MKQTKKKNTVGCDHKVNSHLQTKLWCVSYLLLDFITRFYYFSHNFQILKQFSLISKYQKCLLTLTENISFHYNFLIEIQNENLTNQK